MKKILTFTFVFFCLAASYAQFNYPATKTVDVKEAYFGVTYKDPYRWLEDFKDPQVVSWFKKQATFCNDILNKISGRDELVAEWKMLDKLQPPRIGGRTYENGRIFYRKTMPGEDVSKLYYREGYEGKEQLLFDPSTFIKGKKLSIQSALPSYDGKKIIIGYAEAGAEISTIKVLEVATKSFLPETIYPSWFGPISWTTQPTTVLPELPPGTGHIPNTI